MADQVEVGSRIRIEVIQAPRSTASRKTLLRLMLKDPALHKRHQVNRRHRRAAIKVRSHAGRPWRVIPKKALPVRGEPGESATILASADVVVDLRRLGPYVKITPA
jgi:hypothetical protein